MGGVTRPDTRALWNANAAAWTDLSRAGFDRYRDLVNTPAFFRLLPPVGGLTCLDLGCGEGHNTRLLAGQGACVAALDVAESFITAAAGQDRSRIRYTVGDGTALPFRASAFDAVTAFMSLMDVAEPERTLGEVARVLRPGGFVPFSALAWSSRRSRSPAPTRRPLTPTPRSLTPGSPLTSSSCAPESPRGRTFWCQDWQSTQTTCRRFTGMR
jgi:SAM-dependent methyltransferase